jgi:hypothetical protein
MIQNHKSHLPCHPESTSICSPTGTWAGRPGVHIPSICPPGLEYLGFVSPVYFLQRVPGLEVPGFVIPVYVHQRVPGLEGPGFVSQYMSINGYLGWTVRGSYPQYMSTSWYLGWNVWGSYPSIWPATGTWAGESGVRNPCMVKCIKVLFLD